MLKCNSCQRKQFGLLGQCILGCLGTKHFFREILGSSDDVSGVHLCREAAFASSDWTKCLRVTSVFRFWKCAINYSTLQKIKFVN